MRGRKLVILAITALALVSLWGTGPVFAGEQVKLTLQRAPGLERGSGQAVIDGTTPELKAKDLKPNAVYTVWWVNTEPTMEIAGVGEAPYTFKTNRKGAGTFKATLASSPFGRWQMLKIIRHTTGDPRDMQSIEDALWAPLAKAAGKAANPCAAR